tara:strand:- start:212 stop:1117 length:906 start_codon:yes stop_codon:yes gene_type:complete
MSENTQLTLASGYDINNIIFSDVQHESIPKSVPQINYKRITIRTKNSDGTIGDLILPTEKLFSFGVSENTNQETGKVNGYVMPLCLHTRDGATKEEKDWSETFTTIVEKCKDHLLANKEEIEHFDLERTDLKKLNPLYYKREKGKIVPGTGPTLYAKLIVSKKQDNKILTMYFDFNGDSVDPLTLLGKYCYARAAVKIESIFVGSKISLQVKLYECEVKLMETGMKQLLRRPKAQQRVLTSNTSKPLEEKSEPQPDGFASDGSVNDSDGFASDTEKKEEAHPPKKVVKRKVKKVIRKMGTE